MKRAPNGSILEPHQRSVIEWYRKRPAEDAKKGIIVCHSTGTMTALCTAKVMLDDAVVSKTYVLVNKSVKEHWKNCIRTQLFMEPQEQIVVLTHAIGLKRLAQCRENFMIIVDEAHVMRNSIEDPEKRHAEHLQEYYKGKKRSLVNEPQTAWSFLEVCSRAHLVMLLTVTPVVDDVDDLKNLIMAVHGMNYDVGKFEFGSWSKCGRPTYEEMMNLFSEGKLSSYVRGAFSVHYPDLPDSCTQEFVRLPMSNDDYVEWYRDIERNIQAKDVQTFVEEIRKVRCPDEIQSPKIEYITRKLNEWVVRDREKTIIWTIFETDVLKDILNGLDVPFACVWTRSQQECVWTQFNSGEVMVVVYNFAGVEGLDLRGCRRFVLLEPHWNMYRVNQVIARDVNNPLNVYFVSINESVDDLVMRVATEKHTWERIHFRKFLLEHNVESIIQEEEEEEEEQKSVPRLRIVLKTTESKKRAISPPPCEPRKKIRFTFRKK